MIILSLFISTISSTLLLLFLFNNKFQEYVWNKSPKCMENISGVTIILGVSIIPVFNLIWISFVIITGIVFIIMHKVESIEDKFKKKKGNK